MRRPRRPAHAGFTLVEVLVAFTLLSAVMLALGAAMRTMAQSEERLDRHLAATDHMRVVAAFLDAVLGRVSTERPAQATQAGESEFLFAARPADLQWVGVMPARHGMGGRHFFRLAAEATPEGSALVLRYLPWSGEAAFPADWSAAPSRVLVPQLAGFGLLYCAAEVAPGGCGPAWTEPKRLPARIVVQLADARGSWPDQVVVVRPVGRRGTRQGGFSLGPE